MAEVELKRLTDKANKLRDSLRQAMFKLSDVTPKQPPVPVQLQCRKKLAGHKGKIDTLAWGGGPSANKVISFGHSDGYFLVWNVAKGQRTQLVPISSPWIMCCDFEKTEGRMVAFGGLDNSCVVYDLTKIKAVSNASNPPQPLGTLNGHEGYLTCCRFVQRKKLLTSSGDSTCIEWDLDRMDRSIHKFTGHTSDVMSVSVCPTNCHLFVSGSTDGTAKVWDTRSGNCEKTFFGHESDVNSVEFLANGHSIGTGCDDSKARLFDLRAPHPLGVYQHGATTSGICSITFSKSGRMLFVAFENGDCFVFDTLENSGPIGRLEASGDEPVVGNFSVDISTDESKGNGITCLAMSPDGRALCTGGNDSLVKIWA